MYLYLSLGSSYLFEVGPSEDDIANVAYGRLRVFSITEPRHISELFADWNDETCEGDNPHWVEVARLGA